MYVFDAVVVFVTSHSLLFRLALAILCDVSWYFPKFLTPSLFFPEVWWRHLWMTLRRETCLDKKILTGLLKGQNMTMHYQLYLSMVWDRVDIAEEKIFVHGSECLGKQSSIRWVVIILKAMAAFNLSTKNSNRGRELCKWNLNNTHFSQQ